MALESLDCLFWLQNFRKGLLFVTFWPELYYLNLRFLKIMFLICKPNLELFSNECFNNFDIYNDNVQFSSSCNQKQPEWYQEWKKENFSKGSNFLEPSITIFKYEKKWDLISSKPWVCRSYQCIGEHCCQFLRILGSLYFWSHFR